MENQNLKSPVPGLVSVIVPCYNYGHYLPDALNSVLAQTYPDWECIVVDDGSKDNTAGVAGRYVDADGRFRYVYQENKGLSAARNAGIAGSRGEFLQFLDADDLIQRRKLEGQARYLQATPAVDVVYAEALFFSGSPGTIVQTGNAEYMCYASGAGESLLAAVPAKNLTVVSAPLLRKHVTDRAQGFDETLTAVEDYDFWLRCALAGCRFQYQSLGEDATLIRKGHASMSSSAWRMLKNNVQVRRKIRGRLPTPRLVALNEQYVDKTVALYGDQLYKSAVYEDFGLYFAQLLRAAVMVKRPRLFKLAVAALAGKTMQLLASAKKTGLGIGT